MRAREMVVELDQPGAGQVHQLGIPVKLGRTPGAVRARSGAGRAHRRGAARGGLRRRGDRGAEGGRRGGRPGRRAAGVVPGDGGPGLLKMSELAERSGVSAGTIKHYLREGLLARRARSSDLAQHGLVPAGLRRADPPDQAPAGGAVHALRLIREDGATRRGGAVELEDRILERAAAARRRSRSAVAPGPTQRARPPGRARRAHAQPPTATTPTTSRIIEAIARFRAGGYDERLGFTVYDTLRYREALGPLVQEEVARCSTAWPARSRWTARWRSSPRARSRCASSSGHR